MLDISIIYMCIDWIAGECDGGRGREMWGMMRNSFRLFSPFSTKLATVKRKDVPSQKQAFSQRHRHIHITCRATQNPIPKYKIFSLFPKLSSRSPGFPNIQPVSLCPSPTAHVENCMEFLKISLKKIFFYFFTSSFSLR